MKFWLKFKTITCLQEFGKSNFSKPEPDGSNLDLIKNLRFGFGYLKNPIRLNPLSSLITVITPMPAQSKLLEVLKPIEQQNIDSRKRDTYKVQYSSAGKPRNVYYLLVIFSWKKKWNHVRSCWEISSHYLKGEWIK